MNPQNRRLNALAGILPCLLALGFSDTARSQGTTISVDQPTLNFTVPTNGVSTQQLQISATNSTTVFVGLVNRPGWLTVTPAAANSFPNVNVSSTQPTVLNVTVNTTTIGTGVYQYMFSLTIQGAAVPPLIITVNLTVTPALTLLSANPPSLSFSAQQGAQVGTPQGIPVHVISSAQQFTYTLSVSTTDGHPWLSVFPACSPSIPCTTGPPGFTVSVNPATPGLLPSNTAYQGTVVATSTTTSDSVAIPVTFVVTSVPTLTVSPASLPQFLYQLGSPATQPAQQTLAVTSIGGPIQFTAQLNPPVGWLVLSQTAGSANGSQPVPIQLNINPLGLPTTPGIYNTAVVFSPGLGPAPSAVPVSLVVSTHALLKLGNSALTFTAPFASQTPLTQPVILSTTGDPVGFVTIGDPQAPWLTVTPATGSASSTIPATLTLQVNPSSPSVLPAGDYTGTITVLPQNADGYSLKITVSLSVQIGSQLTAGPGILHFSYQTNQPVPAAQLVQVGSTGQPVPFTISVPPNVVTAGCPANWLTATSPTSTTPVFLTVSVQTTGMQPGTCNNIVTLTPTSGTTPVLNIPVAVDTSNTPELNVTFTPGFGVQSVQQGAVQSVFGMSLSSTDPKNQVTFTANSNAPWLAVAPTTLTQTPLTLTVLVSPSAPVQLSANPSPYQAAITITSTSLPSSFVQVPYSLTVNPNITVTVTPPNLLTFTQPQGGPVPPSQNLTLTATGGNPNYTATVTSVTGGAWLTISSASGTINSSGTITASVNPTVANLLAASPNPYTSKITLAFPGSSTAPVTITANLLVNQAQTFSVAPALLTFTYQTGGAAPASQALNITSTGGPVNFTVGTTSSSGWLSVDSTSGTTPKTINVTADPQKIPAGTLTGVPLTGTVAISAPGLLTVPILVNVTFTILPPPIPQPTTILNSASIASGAIAPGELIAIKGSLLGPQSPINGTVFTVNGQGGVDSTLAGVQVLFDAVAGTPTFVSANQINVIVPYEIAGRPSTTLTIIYQGMQSAPIPLVVAASGIAPAIYTRNATGQGQIAAVNVTGATAGTINGPLGALTTPATQGSIIAVFGTGGGQTNPASVTGSVSPTNTVLPLIGWTAGSNTVTATVGGQPATVLFAGAAPSLVTGVFQVNLQLPAGVTGDGLPISISINGVPTPGGTTVAVQ